ncbi:hypothetical protein ACJJTC_017564 [Scirpophaga incertulas]
MSSRKSTYKSCIVPQCKNTSIRTPNKIFISMPRGERVRKIWCKAMKWDLNKPLSSISSRYCCEDHFEIEKDLENFMRWKMMGGPIRLKTGIVPHIFDCQRRPLRKSVKARRNTAKAKHIRNNQEALNTPQPSASPSNIEYVDCGIEINPIYIDENPQIRPVRRKTQGRQEFQVPVKSGTDFLDQISVPNTACLPIKLEVSYDETSPIQTNILDDMMDSKVSFCKQESSECG